MTSRALWRSFAVSVAASAALASFAAAFASCAGGYVEDPAGFCLDEPADARCQGAAAGRAGEAGTAGQGGSMPGGSGGVGGGGSGGAPPVGGSAGAGSGGTAGQTPGCVAPAVDCDGRCVEVATDVAHCGACGYACGAGSTCAEGACSAVAVVSGVVAPYAFALDAQNLYFAVPVKGPGDVVPSAVQKVARDGGGSPAPVFDGNPTFRSRSLARSEGTLYFGALDNNGSIRKGATTGGDVATHLADQPAVQQLVAADGNLWWSVLTPVAQLRRAGEGTGATAEEQLPLPLFHTGRIVALAAEGSPAALYWVNRDASAVENKGGLWHKPDGAEATLLVAGGQMVALALGADGIYVADAAAGIGKASKTVPQATLTSVVVAAQVGGSVQGLTVTATRLYWLAFEAGQLALHRSGLDGSGARVLGRVAVASEAYWTQPIGPSQLTVDGGFVYFSDVGSVTGNTQASNPGLEGVTGAADGAIYRLPE